MAQTVAAPGIATPGITRRFAGVVGDLWKDKAGYFGLLVM